MNARPSPARWFARATRTRHAWLWLSLAAAALAPAAAAAETAGAIATPPPMLKMVSHVGISRVAFTRLNENDAKAAHKILNVELGKKLGYDLDVEINQFETPAEFARVIRAHRASYIIAGTWEFLHTAVEDAVDIGFSAVNGDAVAHRWLLLVRRDSGLRSFDEVAMRVAIPPGANRWRPPR